MKHSQTTKKPTNPNKPLTFRQFIKLVNPKYKFYAHVEKLIVVLQRVADGEISRLMVFMPPRHSKSESVSRLFTAYYLYRYPDRWVGLCSYADALASTLSRNARENYKEAGGTLSQDAGAVHHWETGKGGGFWASGVGGPATGKGFHLGVIDDPVKNDEEAQSLTIRQRNKDWYLSTFYTREEPGAAIVVVQCMTGDTPVLMADGTERRLREIKVGDKVATYDDGKLSVSKVLNHKSNRDDYIFKITTTCGKIVRANARHPFLVEEHGQLKWVRLKNLTTAHKIVILKDNGENGKEKPAWPKDAKSQQNAGVTAILTTKKRNGLMGIALNRLIQNLNAIGISSIGMALLLLSMTQCLLRKMASVLFANKSQGQMRLPTGRENYASIIATKPIPLEDSCVTTAILPSVTPKMKQQHALWSNTSDFTLTQIESIEPAGIEEVFDVQIERTENFIANGLVSHNTRWHEDDLSGWLLSQEGSEEDEPERWHIVSMEAIKEHKPADWPATCTIEPDERHPGEALCPERYDIVKLNRRKKRLGSYYWNSLYQQRPSPDEGGIFKRHWWRYWKPKGVNLPPVYVKLADASLVEIQAVELPDYFDDMAQSWDCSFKDTKASDFVAGLVLGKVGANKYMLDYYKEHADISKTMSAIEGFSVKWPRAYAKLVEDKANGPAVIQLLTNKIAGLIAVEPEGGKLSRAYATSPTVEAHNVFLPHPLLFPWVQTFIDNCANFPNSAHDDDIDAFTQVVIRWENAPAPVPFVQGKAQGWNPR